MDKRNGKEKIMIEVRNVQKANLNGRPVKIFEVWEMRGNAWIFAGKYSAPVRTANKNLPASAGF